MRGLRILFVDDTREPKDVHLKVDEDDILIARTASSAINVLAGTPFGFNEIWLDFDLGFVYGQHEFADDSTAMPIALWLCEEAFYGRQYPVGTIYIHSMNPVGSQAMKLVLERYGYTVSMWEII